MKTSELIGPALAWAVGIADKRIIRFGIGGSLEVRGRTENGDELPEGWDMWMLWYPQSNWSQGGPIIERELIRVIAPTVRGVDWVARIKQPLLSNMDGWFENSGPTPLIAAMRAYAASKLGDEVEIPKELLGEL